MAELNIKTLFAALSRELQGNGEFNQRVTAHIRAVHGYNTIPAFHCSADVPEKDKVTAYGVSMAAIIKFKKAKAAGDQAGMDAAWDGLQGQELPKGQAAETVKTEPVPVKTEPTPAHKVIEVETVVAPSPTPLPAPAQTADQAVQLAQLLQQMLAANSNNAKPATLDPEQVKVIVGEQLNALSEEVRAKVAEHLASIPPREVVEIVVKKDGEEKHNEIPRQHYKFPLLMKCVEARVNTLLVGPAGTGKSTAFVKAAEALGVPVEVLSIGPQTSKADILGYAGEPCKAFPLVGF